MQVDNSRVQGAAFLSEQQDVFSSGADNTGSIPWVALLTLVVGAFMAILDGSIVNVALPRFMSIFGSGADEIQWIMTAYLLVSGVVVPITGYLGDRYGNKTIYIFSLAFFTVGSVLCSLAWGTDSLIATRVIQAIGGGMIMPVSMSMIFFIVPRDKIGMALGVWGISAMAAPSIGPTLGGYLVDNFSWHFIFLINIPIGIAAIFLALAALKETPRRKDLKPDVPGMILVTAGCFALLLALSEGQDRGWASLYIVNLLVVAVFSFILFVLWEMSVPEPLLDIRLLQNRIYTISLIGTGILTVGLFAAIFMIPLFAQIIQGYTPMQTGLMLMPMAVTTGILMPVSGRLFDKIGALPLCLVGLVIAAVATYQLHTITVETSFRQLQWMLVERAIGLGLAMMPISIAGMSTVPHFLVGRASAMGNLVRQVAASFGIAYLTYFMLHRQAEHAARMAETVSWSSPVALAAQQQAQGILAQAGLSAQAGAAGVAGLFYEFIQKQAFAAGIADSFVVSAVILLAALPFVFFLGKKKVEAVREAEHRRYARLMPGNKALPEGKV
ncbi:MAG: DHA2 family efflux MFS transporter permease subunit [Peptococcaceae bacterium]|nr:MAG: DHA2 family efflux MFS transporter permease subunit [Peptococcaceae bacterium]